MVRAELLFYSLFSHLTKNDRLAGKCQEQMRSIKFEQARVSHGMALVLSVVFA